MNKQFSMTRRVSKNYSDAMRRNVIFLVLGLSAAVLQGCNRSANTQPPIASEVSKPNSLSTEVKANLKQIRELMEGSHTDRKEEGLILKLFAGSIAAELDELIGAMSQDEFRTLIAKIDNRLVGPDNRTAFLNLLSKERLADLTVESRAKLIGTLQYHKTDALDEKTVLEVFLGTKGADLTKLKKAIDHGGDHRDLQNLVFHDIDDLQIRKELVDYLREQGAIARTKLKKVPVNVFSDIDDTFYRSLNDHRYPGNPVYPGVRQFYTELDKGGAPEEDALGDLIFLSARPEDRAGVDEALVFKTLNEKGVNDPTIVLGNLVAGASFDDELIAKVKFKDWKQYCELYPEYDSVLIGDSGQGDAIFGKDALDEPNTNVKAVFIHRVTDIDDKNVKGKKRDAFEDKKRIHYFHTYVGAATEAFKLGLITKDGLKRAAAAAEDELKKVPFTSDTQRDERKKQLDDDLKAMEAALK